MQLEQTFMHFLLKHQQTYNRTLNFLILMESILTAARYIQYHFNNGALQGKLGEAGKTNVQGESVMQMDLLAHQIVMHYLKESNQVIEATSEEVSDEIKLNPDGRYFVYFDPLDGSSNIKHSLPVGFMFAVAKRNLTGSEDYHLRSGEELICSGMFSIPTGLFTFALKNAGAWRFYMDASGDYIRPTKITLPSNKENWELSWNVANKDFYKSGVQDWLTENASKHAFRYAGSLAIDFHRLLLNGGMFLYPAIVNHHEASKNRPQGKLRLMYECNVIAFIAKEAGGIAINDQGEDILKIIPTHRHQRSSIYVGNSDLVESVRKVLSK